MKHAAWEKLIKSNCMDAGTYRPFFDGAIKTLAMILEKRDQALKEWKDDGGQMLVEYTNKGGSTNVVTHPLLIVWRDLNTQALAYWKDLGLTPGGLKKINDAALTKQEKGSALEAAILKLTSEA